MFCAGCKMVRQKWFLKNGSVSLRAMWLAMLFSILVNNVLAIEKSENARLNEDNSLDRQKRADCPCQESNDSLKCRCHTGENAFDQVCRCARSVRSSCGCSMNQGPVYFMPPPTTSFVSGSSGNCQPICERSCTQSCTAQLQPAAQCASTCQFTCQKTCGQFQVNIQSDDKTVPHVMIVGGTETPPTCQCAKNEPDCPCNCVPRCQNNCQQNCKNNGQSPRQCSNTCEQTCQSTCLAYLLVQNPPATKAPSSSKMSCMNQCPVSCRKVCIKLTAVPMCQQQCVQTCNNNCATMVITTTEPPTLATTEPEPVTEPVEDHPDCIPACQPECLNTCTMADQTTEPTTSEPSTTVPMASTSPQCISPCMPLCEPQCVGHQPYPAPYPAPGLQFGYVYNQPVATGYQQYGPPLLHPYPAPLPQQATCVTACQPQCALACVAREEQNARSQQTTADPNRMVTVTLCIPQCMPACAPDCIEKVASALQQALYHQNQHSPQTSANLPMPSEGVTCPKQCMPLCQPQCLVNLAPNYLAVPQVSKPIGMVLPPPLYTAPGQTGHVQNSIMGSNLPTRFSMLPSNTEARGANANKVNNQKTCIKPCMPLCREECIQAGLREVNHNNATFNQMVFQQQTQNQNRPNIQIQSQSIQQTSTTTTQPSVPDQQKNPMRIMIQYTASSQVNTVTTPIPTMFGAPTPPATNKNNATKETQLNGVRPNQPSPVVMFMPKLMPASMIANMRQGTGSMPSNGVLKTAMASHRTLSPPPAITVTPTAQVTSSTVSSGARSLQQMIRQKCDASCEKVCDSECRKQKNPPDDVCVLTCQHDCVGSCSRKFASKIHT